MHKLIHRLFSSTKSSGVAKILAPASLAGLVALSFGLITSHTSQTAFATTSSTVTFDITDAVSIRLVDKTDTNVITSLDMSLVVTPKGTFVSDWFNAEISTSNATGYTLYMTSDYQSDGSTYTTDLINSDDATFTIPTLAANVSKTDFSTPGGSYLNRWGYSLDDTTYSPVPAHTTSATLKTTTTEVNKDLVPIHVGVMADMNKASGLYKNSLVFTAIPNPIPTEYSLYFQPGTTDTVTNLPATMTSSEVAAQHTFTIPSTEPSRVGYSFTGYLDEETGTEYQAGDTITVIGNEDYTGSATLTAQWELASYTVNITNSNTTSGASSLSVPYGGSKTVTVTPSSGYYLSAVSCPSGYTCSGYSTGTSATGTQTVTVKNDNTTSGGTLAFTGTLAEKTWDTITAMQDMTTKICNSASTDATKTLTDTRDNNTYTVRKLKDGKCWMTQNLRLVGSRTLTSADSNVSANFTLTASDSGTWCTEDSAACDDKSMVLYSDNTTYGTYYNWYAATAGTGKYSTSSGNVSSSVCPKGWRLPTGGFSGEFQTLYNNYNSPTLMMGDPAFVLSGVRYSSNTLDQGSYGDYWSSTAYNSNYANYLNLYGSTYVFPTVYTSKYRGYTVRCVAQ